MYCPKHASTDGSIKAIFMTIPHDHEEGPAARKQRPKYGWKFEKSDPDTNPDDASFGPKAKKSKKLKMASNQRLATALVTQHNMNQQEADDVFKAAYDGSEYSLN